MIAWAGIMNAAGAAMLRRAGRGHRPCHRQMATHDADREGQDQQYAHDASQEGAGHGRDMDPFAGIGKVANPTRRKVGSRGPLVGRISSASGMTWT